MRPAAGRRASAGRSGCNLGLSSDTGVLLPGRLARKDASELKKDLKRWAFVAV